MLDETMKNRRFRVHSLQQRILLSFLLLIVLFTAIGAIGYRLSLRSDYDLTIDAVETSLRHIDREADIVFQDILNRVLEVAADPDLQMSLRRDLPEEMKDVYKERLNYNNWLYYQKIRIRQMDGLYIIGENGAMFHSSYSFRADEYRDTWWYQQVTQEKQILWIAPHSGSELGNNLDALTMSILVPIRDRASTRVLGVAAAEMQMKDLEAVVFADPAFAGILCVMDENGQIIYYGKNSSVQEGEAEDYPEEELLNAEWSAKLPETLPDLGDRQNTLLHVDGREYITVFSQLSDSPWRLMCLVPSARVLADTMRLWRAMLLAGVVLILVGVVFSFVVSSSIVRPLRKVQAVMGAAEKGDLNIRVQQPGKDEIGDLARGFNHMIGRISELMISERETQEKLKIADFNALQSQINPHFLYNTLDSINWMARMGQTQQVEKMIDSLTSFLRIGLSRGRTFISLGEEIKHVESYFAIQQVRYRSLLHYRIDIPENLWNYRMIKMTLQPLVENALYHGIKEKDEPGVITITAQEKEEQILIRVEDDGIGMTPERLAQVRSMMESGEAPNRDAYGIINVQRRIRSYFGEEYGLTFESEYGKGTTVTVIVPKWETEEENV